MEPRTLSHDFRLVPGVGLETTGDKIRKIENERANQR